MRRTKYSTDEWTDTEHNCRFPSLRTQARFQLNHKNTKRIIRIPPPPPPPHSRSTIHWRATSNGCKRLALLWERWRSGTATRLAQASMPAWRTEHAQSFPSSWRFLLLKATKRGEPMRFVKKLNQIIEFEENNNETGLCFVDQPLIGCWMNVVNNAQKVVGGGGWQRQKMASLGKCVRCGKTCYQIEGFKVGPPNKEQVYHKGCFKCT